MTLAELEQECGPKAKRLCQTCEPEANRAELPPHIFVMYDELLGINRQMTFTDDGRIVPLDAY